MTLTAAVSCGNFGWVKSMKLLAKILLSTGALVTTGALVGVGVRAAPGLPLDQMLAKATAINAQIHEDYQHVIHLQAIARKEKDVIKLNCVNDKLVLLKPEMNLADHAKTDLETSREAGDQRQSLEIMVGAGDQVRRLREGAEQCIGEKLLITESSNDYTHPDIPGSPVNDPYGSNPMEPPAYASPFD